MQINLWAAENTASLIIEDENSPVTYSNQTNGYACSHPEVNGYLVPVEFKGGVAEKFVNEGYAGNGWELDSSFYDDIPQIFEQLGDYFCDEYSFELDESRKGKNTETWVHITAKRVKPAQKYHGIIQGFPDIFTAILTWLNSD